MNDRTYTIEELAELAFHCCRFCEFFDVVIPTDDMGYCTHFRVDVSETQGTRCECFVRRAS